VTAGWLWARSRLRRRWRSLLVIAVVTGLGAGVALTAAGGSRRAATGWQRFRAATASANLFFSPPLDPETQQPDTAKLRDAARLPGVTASGAFIYTPVSPASVDPYNELGAFVALDPGFTTSVYRPRILSGRRPSLRAADEVTVNKPLADLAGIKVGERIPLRSGWAPGPFTNLGRVTVVGIHVGQFDVAGNAAAPNMLLSDAFRRAHEDALMLEGQPVVLVRLAAGDGGAAAFQRQLQSVYPGGAVVVPAAQEEAGAIDAVNVQRIGLGLLALAAGLATLVSAVQALGRVFGAERSDIAILRSLGMRRRDLAAAGAGIGATAGVLAAATATIIGVLASRLVPSGTAGRVEPPGLRVEPMVLVAGAALVVIALAGSGALMAVRVATRVPRAGRAQPAVAAGPLPVRLGVHWAFSRSTPGAASGSARAALVAVAIGMAGITALVTFAASLSHLVSTHELYGWDFDGGFKSEELDRAQLQDALGGLVDDRRVEGLAWGSTVDIQVGGSGLEVFALDHARGIVHPSVIEGRAPVGSDEIALGTETLVRLGLHVGSRVMVGEGKGVPFRVVGRAVYPELGFNADLANAGSITVGGLDRLEAEPVGSFALVRLRPGASVGAVLKEHSAEGIDSGPPFVPPRVTNMQTVGALPWLMAGFLAVLALTAVGHALALSVRSRRQDLAVLRAIGAVRVQVAAAVWSQATLTVLAGSIVGLPIGVAVGRQSWALVADGLGVVDSPVLAWALLGGTVALGLAVANLVATGPAFVAARLRPAVALRSE
jgi:ABC-type lipoprotein release transport system permease subunit